MPFQKINTFAPSTEILPALTGGKFYRLVGFFITVNGPADITFLGGATEVVPLTVNADGGGGAVVPPYEEWAIDLPMNTALNLALSETVTAKGGVTYRVIG